MHMTSVILIFIGIVGIINSELFIVEKLGGNRWIFVVIFLLGAVKLQFESKIFERNKVIIDRVLLILWAVMLAFLCVSWLGTTHILSRIFSATYIGDIADILFFFLCALFTGILWWGIPQPMPLKMKLAASLPPLLVLLFFVAS